MARGVALRTRLPHARQRLRQPAIVDRFEQVIGRGGFECADRVMVVRGHEHDERHFRSGNVAQRFEAIDTGHLHVEEHQVRPLRVHRRDRRRTISILADDVDVGMVAEAQLQATPRQRLVVDDDRAYPRGCAVFASIRIAPHPDGLLHR